MLRHGFLFFFLCGFIPLLSGQNLPLKTVFIDGYVLDSLDTQPISNVAVQLFRKTGDTSIWFAESVSNRYGQFSFQFMLPDTQVLRPADFPISVIRNGYSTARVDMPDKAIKTISYEALRGTIYLSPEQRTNTLPKYASRESAVPVRISGLVLDSASNMPLGAAKVKVYLGKKLLYESRTQNDGGFISDAITMTPTQTDSLIMEVDAKFYRIGKTTRQVATRAGKGYRFFSDSKPVVNFTALLVSEKAGVQLIPVKDK